jgi:hypothetical protein
MKRPAEPRASRHTMLGCTNLSGRQALWIFHELGRRLRGPEEAGTQGAGGQQGVASRPRSRLAAGKRSVGGGEGDRLQRMGRAPAERSPPVGPTGARPPWRARGAPGRQPWILGPALWHAGGCLVGGESRPRKPRGPPLSGSAGAALEQARAGDGRGGATLGHRAARGRLTRPEPPSSGRARAALRPCSASRALASAVMGRGG